MAKKKKKSARRTVQPSDEHNPETPAPRGFIADSLREATALIANLELPRSSVGGGDANNSLESLTSDAVERRFAHANKGLTEFARQVNEDFSKGIISQTPKDDYGLVLINSSTRAGGESVQGMDPEKYLFSFYESWKKQAEDPNSAVTPELVEAVRPLKALVRLIYDNRVPRFGHLYNSRTTRHLAKKTKEYFDNITDLSVPLLSAEEHSSFVSGMPPAWRGINDTGYNLAKASREPQDQFKLNGADATQDGLNSIVDDLATLSEENQRLTSELEEARRFRDEQPATPVTSVAPPWSQEGRYEQPKQPIDQSTLKVNGAAATQDSINGILKTNSQLNTTLGEKEKAIGDLTEKLKWTEEERAYYQDAAVTEAAHAKQSELDLKISFERYTVHGPVIISERSRLREAEREMQTRLKVMHRGEFDLNSMIIPYSEPQEEAKPVAPDGIEYGKLKSKYEDIKSQEKQASTALALKESEAKRVEWTSKSADDPERKKYNSELEKLTKKHDALRDQRRKIEEILALAKSGEYVIYSSYIDAEKMGLPPGVPALVMLTPDQARTRREEAGEQVIHERRNAMYAQVASGFQNRQEGDEIRYDSNKKKFFNRDGSVYEPSGLELLARQANLEKDIDDAKKENEKKQKEIDNLTGTVTGLQAQVAEKERLKKDNSHLKSKLQTSDESLTHQSDRNKRRLSEITSIIGFDAAYFDNAGRFVSDNFQIPSLPGMELESKITTISEHFDSIFSKVYESLSPESRPLFEMIFSLGRNDYFDRLVSDATILEQSQNALRGHDRRRSKRFESDSTEDQNQPSPQSQTPDIPGARIPILIKEDGGVYRVVRSDEGADTIRRELSDAEKLNISIIYNLYDSVKDLIGYAPASKFGSRVAKYANFYLSIPQVKAVVDDFRTVVSELKDRKGHDPELEAKVKTLEDAVAKTSEALCEAVDKLEYVGEYAHNVGERLGRSSEENAELSSELRSTKQKLSETQGQISGLYKHLDTISQIEQATAMLIRERYNEYAASTPNPESFQSHLHKHFLDIASDVPEERREYVAASYASRIMGLVDNANLSSALSSKEDELRQTKGALRSIDTYLEIILDTTKEDALLMRGEYQDYTSSTQNSKSFEEYLHNHFMESINDVPEDQKKLLARTYSSRITELVRVAELTRNVSGLEEELTETRNQRDIELGNYEGVSSTLERERAEHAAYEADSEGKILHLTEKLTDASVRYTEERFQNSRELTAKTAYAKTLEGQNAKLVSSLEAMTQEAATLSGRLGLEQENSQFYEGRWRSAEKTTSETAAKLAAKTQYATELEDNNSQLQGELTSTQQTLAGTRRELGLVRSNYETLDTKSEGLASDLAAKTEEANQYSTRIRQQEIELAEAEKESDGYRSKIEGLTREADQYSTRIRQQEIELAEAEKQSAVYQSEIASLNESLNDKKLESESLNLQLLIHQLELEAHANSAEERYQRVHRTGEQLYLMHLSDDFIQKVNNRGIRHVASMVGLYSNETIPTELVRSSVQKYKTMLHNCNTPELVRLAA